jgi:transposase
VWWSCLARPALSSWADPDRPLRLVEQTVADTDPARKAPACYGLLARLAGPGGGWHERAWLRFVDGRPVSAITTRYLAWCCAQLQAAGKVALLLFWDNAPWHTSRAGRAWIRHHNRQVARTGAGVRIVPCCLPFKSPWLNPIEAKWAHGKRRVVEPSRLLAADELIERLYAAFGCRHEPQLSIHHDAA